MESPPVKIGILNFQGAAQDHISHLKSRRAGYELVRNGEQLQTIDGLIIPGGESTVIGKFLRKYCLQESLRALVEQGMPLWGICAGAILLTDNVDGRKGENLSLLDVEIRRNAYGRQLASTEMRVFAPRFLPPEGEIMPFIRAPRFVLTKRSDVEVVAYVKNGDPVGIVGGEHKRILATTFHPELTGNGGFHKWFIGEAEQYSQRQFPAC